MKKFASLSLAVVLTASLFGCSSASSGSAAGSASGTSTAAGEEPVTIQFMHGMVEQERQEVIQGLIDEFEEAHPNITVEQIPTDDSNFDTKITALAGSGELPALIEVNQNRAKMLAKDDLTDYDAVRTVIESRGEDTYYDNILKINTTEDGQNYIGVPVGGWVQGIWYDKDAFAEKGLEAPTTWENILAAAQAFYDPDNRQYGIALPTVEGSFSEQSFSQFALSNNANVFDADGNVTFNTPEMVEALAFYQELYQYSIQGSNDTTEVQDAFLNGSAPMAIYSTYILSGVNEAGMMDRLGFAVPENVSSASYGSVGMITVTADLDDAQRQAAIEFLEFLITNESNVKWLHMAPGGQQPVLPSVATDEAYLDNETIQSFSHLSEDISGAFDSIQLFGIVDGKNFLSMGDVTSSGVIARAVNSVTVKGEDPQAVAESTQSEIEDLIG